MSGGVPSTVTLYQPESETPSLEAVKVIVPEPAKGVENLIGTPVACMNVTS